MHRKYSIKSLKKYEKAAKEYGNNCGYCGVILNWQTFTIDHVRAKSKGGLNNKKNKLPACVKCNTQKGSGTLEQFRQKLGVDRFYFETHDTYLHKVKDRTDWKY